MGVFGVALPVGGGFRVGVVSCPRADRVGTQFGSAQRRVSVAAVVECEQEMMTSWMGATLLPERATEADQRMGNIRLPYDGAVAAS